MRFRSLFAAILFACAGAAHAALGGAPAQFDGATSTLTSATSPGGASYLVRSTTLAGTYYECVGSACTPVAMPLASQVANPVASFAVNNNGAVLAMPAVAAGGATTLTGALIFGVDTQSNNQVGSATVYATNASGNFTTTYKGVALTSSFLDSGSSGYFFSDTAIASCVTALGFYCPPTPLALSAVNTSANGAASGTVNFSIESIEALDPSIRAALVGGILSRSTRNRAFDWGMPFFYGRTVFVVMQGASSLHGSGPYWAY